LLANIEITSNAPHHQGACAPGNLKEEEFKYMNIKKIISGKIINVIRPLNLKEKA
jgi:hypothetical protein